MYCDGIYHWSLYEDNVGPHTSAYTVPWMVAKGNTAVMEFSLHGPHLPSCDFVNFYE